jgi:hypothetical protein
MSPAGPRRPSRSGEVIVEFVSAGGFLRCAVVDVDTGAEAHATGPVSAGRDALERIAMGKLKRALAARRAAD